MLDPQIFVPRTAKGDSMLPPSKGSGYLVLGSGPRVMTVCVAFEAVAAALKMQCRVLCVTHPSSVHQSLPCFTPLETLPSSQLQLLEFLYASTLVEALQAIALIGVDDSDIPELLFVDISSFDDCSDTCGVLRLLALVDNTIRSLRELQADRHNMSVCVLSTTGPLPSSLSIFQPSSHTTLPLCVVPNPVILVEPLASDTIAVSLLPAATDTPSSTAAKRGMYTAKFSGQDVQFGLPTD